MPRGRVRRCENFGPAKFFSRQNYFEIIHGFFVFLPLVDFWDAFTNQKNTHTFHLNTEHLHVYIHTYIHILHTWKNTSELTSLHTKAPSRMCSNIERTSTSQSMRGVWILHSVACSNGNQSGHPGCRSCLVSSLGRCPTISATISSSSSSHRTLQLYWWFSMRSVFASRP